MLVIQIKTQKVRCLIIFIQAQLNVDFISLNVEDLWQWFQCVLSIEYRVLNCLTVGHTDFQTMKCSLEFHVIVQFLSSYHFVSIHNNQNCVCETEPASE